MNEYASIDDEIELTLNSLDGLQVATAPKFLYARVLRRLKNRESTIYEKISLYVSHPIIAMAIILLVVILDLQVISQKRPDKYSLPDLVVKSIYQEDYELAANFYDYDLQEQ